MSLKKTHKKYFFTIQYILLYFIFLLFYFILTIENLNKVFRSKVMAR